MTNDRHKTPAFSLRLENDLRSDLTRSAKDNGRSLNAEISIRLKDSYKQPDINADLIRTIISEEISKALGKKKSPAKKQDHGQQPLL